MKAHTTMPVQMVFTDSRDYMNQKVRSLVAEYSMTNETCLASKDVMSSDLLKKKLMLRLGTLGKSNEEHIVNLLSINYRNGPISHSVVLLPHTEQRNLSFGVAGSMVQTATGSYSVVSSLFEAPKYAYRIY
ncbi:hypothetical protein Bca101_068384 [Brassica carinata]